VRRSTVLSHPLQSVFLDTTNVFEMELNKFELDRASSILVRRYYELLMNFSSLSLFWP
jgi:hypothetical protein